MTPASVEQNAAGQAFSFRSARAHCGSSGRGNPGPSNPGRGGFWRMAAALLCCAALTACAAPRAGGTAGGPSANPGPSVPSGDAAAPGFGVPISDDGRAQVALLAPIGDSRAQVAALGQALANAAQLAQTDIGDPRLALRVYDTRGDRATAEAAAAQAVRDGASLIIGPLFSSSIDAVGPVARTAGLTMISFSTDPAAAGGNVFLLGFSAENEIERVTSYAATQGILTFGALTPQTAYGALAGDAFAGSVAGVGGRLALRQSYTRDFRGIEAAATEYAEAHKAQGALDPITGVLIADDGQALQTVAAYLAFLDVSPRETKYLGVGGWNADVTWKETALRGGWFAAPDPRLQAQFMQRYEAAYGETPPLLASLGYDAMAAAGAMLAEARARGETFPFTVDAITEPRGFAGVNGAFRFREDGMNERALAILEVQADGFTVIDPAPSGFAGF